MPNIKSEVSYDFSCPQIVIYKLCLVKRSKRVPYTFPLIHTSSNTKLLYFTTYVRLLHMSVHFIFFSQKYLHNSDLRGEFLCMLFYGNLTLTIELKPTSPCCLENLNIVYHSDHHIELS